MTHIESAICLVAKMLGAEGCHPQDRCELILALGSLIEVYNQVRLREHS